MIEGFSTIEQLVQLKKSAIDETKKVTWPDGHNIGRQTKGRYQQKQQLTDCRLKNPIFASKIGRFLKCYWYFTPRKCTTALTLNTISNYLQSHANETHF